MARKRNRIRMAMNTRDVLTGSLDMFRSANPNMPRARALQIELAFFDGTPSNGAPLEDIGDLISVTFDVKALVTDVGALMSKTLAAAALNPTLNLDLWNAGVDSDSHAMFTFLDSETGLNLGGATQASFVLVVTGLTSIGNITLGTAILTCINDGGLSASNTPAAGDPAYLRVDQFQAAIAGLVKVIGDPGVPIILRSKGSKFQRRLGIDDLGNDIDEDSKIG